MDSRRNFHIALVVLFRPDYFGIIKNVGNEKDFDSCIWVEGKYVVILVRKRSDLGVELCTQDLVNFLRRRLFQDNFSRWRDRPWHQLRRTFVYSLFCEAGRKTTYFYSQGQNWALELLCLKLPGTWKHVPWWLWICCCVVFVCLYVFLHLVWHGSWADVEEKNAKIFVKMDTECWKLLVKKDFSLKELIVII